MSNQIAFHRDECKNLNFVVGHVDDLEDLTVVNDPEDVPVQKWNVVSVENQNLKIQMSIK